MEISLDMEIKKKAGPQLDWEEVGGRIEIDRAMVPGGWLITLGGGRPVGVTFVPDPDHTWK